MKITQPVRSLCIITFQKSFIDLKSTQNITLKFGFFQYCMLQNKQSNRYSLYSMTSVVALFAYPIKSNISTRKGVKFYQRSCRIILTDLPNAMKKILDKISFHKHFNEIIYCMLFNQSASINFVMLVINNYLTWYLKDLAK